MSAIKTICAGVTATIGTGVWIFFILYNWLWLGIVNSESTGMIVGYGILFILFIFLSVIVLGVIYVLSIALAMSG
jgi:hypothetical protein